MHVYVLLWARAMWQNWHKSHTFFQRNEARGQNTKHSLHLLKYWFDSGKSNPMPMPRHTLEFIQRVRYLGCNYLVYWKSSREMGWWFCQNIDTYWFECCEFSLKNAGSNFNAGCLILWIIIYIQPNYSENWNWILEFSNKNEMLCSIFVEQNQITTLSFRQNILRNCLVSSESEKIGMCHQSIQLYSTQFSESRFNGKWCHIVSKRGSQDKQPNNNFRVKDFYSHTNEQRFWPCAWSRTNNN